MVCPRCNGTGDYLVRYEDHYGGTTERWVLCDCRTPKANPTCRQCHGEGVIYVISFDPRTLQPSTSKHKCACWLRDKARITHVEHILRVIKDFHVTYRIPYVHGYCDALKAQFDIEFVEAVRAEVLPHIENLVQCQNTVGE